MDTNVLDTIDMRRLGRELRHARERKGITQEAAAQVIGATRTTMVAIEKGERRLRAKELIDLAHAYGRPVNDFVRERPALEPLDIQFRGPFLHSEQDDERIDPVIRDFEDLCRNYVELEHLTSSPMTRKYPAEYETAGLPLEQTAEAIALEERTRLGLGDGPLPILRNVLEQDVGLRIFYLPMPGNFSEIYAFTDQFGGCLAINRVHPEERRRWSLAHGYFHFLSTRQTSEVEQDERYLRQPESERFADAFARYFLMPAGGLSRRFNDIRRKGTVTPTDLCALAYYYCVSPEALTRRLEAMRLLPSGTWESVRDMKWRDLRQQLGLAETSYPDQKLPIRYTLLAYEAFKQGAIGEGQFAQFLEVDRLDARQIALSFLPADKGVGSNSSRDQGVADSSDRQE
jgi:Zn-dependent peptidase ImmA (M78 family)/DNA-binding XRE family transcriptional regulator